MTGPVRISPFQSAYLLGLAVTAFALADFVGPLLVRQTQSEVLLMFLFGVVGAQLGVLVIWAVLGPQRWFVRLSATLAVALLLIGAVCLGATVVEEYAPTAGEVASFLLCLPLVFLAAQLPLWIRRIAGGWRIVRADAETEGPATGARQFRLQDALAATGVLAVALSLARLGLADEGDMDDQWMGFLLLSAMCTVWSAFSTLPCLWACFVARGKLRSAVVMAVYVVVMTAIVLAVISAFVRTAPPGDVVAGFLLFHAALVGVMLGVLHVLRVLGYVLHRTARRGSTTPIGDRPPDADPGEPASPFEPPGPA